jgi:UPF0755 protein
LKIAIKKAVINRIITSVVALTQLLLILILFLLFYLAQPVESKRVVYVPTGSLTQIIPYLQKEGLDISYLDIPLLKMMGYVQAGWIDLKKREMTKWEFLYRLTTSKAALVDVLIKPGESNYFIFKELARKLNLPHLRCPNIEEGFIKPDTYRLPIGMDPKQLCRYLYQISNRWHKSIAERLFGDYNYNVYKKYLIVASIIQKEAAGPFEFRKIASVIYNRLRKGMPLQMDATLNYGKYSHTPVTPSRIRKDHSLYNTYLYKGLPPTPICVVQRSAIIAAVFPAKTKYLYFTKCGNHHLFSTTYQQHLRNIEYCRKFNREK